MNYFSPRSFLKIVSIFFVVFSFLLPLNRLLAAPNFNDVVSGGSSSASSVTDTSGGLNIVPCGDTRPCTACDFYVLAANIFRFMLYLATFLAVLYVAWGGFLMLTAGGNPGNIKKGKTAVQNAIIGLLITFSSWMVVNTFINFLIRPGFMSLTTSTYDCN
jgi:hypothetical protein